jgi:hypothetical protein
VDIFNVWDRVKAGATWLDGIEPDWDLRVDLDELNMRVCGECVLGQVVKARSGRADYWNVVDDGSFHEMRRDAGQPIGLGEDDSTLTIPQATDYGFHTHDDQEWYALTDAWKQLIESRRRAA